MEVLIGQSSRNGLAWALRISTPEMGWLERLDPRDCQKSCPLSCILICNHVVNMWLEWPVCLTFVVGSSRYYIAKLTLGPTVRINYKSLQITQENGVTKQKSEPYDGPRHPPMTLVNAGGTPPMTPSLQRRLSQWHCNPLAQCRIWWSFTTKGDAWSKRSGRARFKWGLGWEKLSGMAKCKISGKMAFVRCLQRISSISIIFYHLSIGRDFTGETGNFYAIFCRIPIIQMIGRCSSVLNPDRTWDKNSWRI